MLSRITELANEERGLLKSNSPNSNIHILFTNLVDLLKIKEGKVLVNLITTEKELKIKNILCCLPFCQPFDVKILTNAHDLIAHLKYFLNAIYKTLKC